MTGTARRWADLSNGQPRRHPHAGSDERGSVIIVFALMVAPILIIAALVIDIGNSSQERRQAQNTADAAALAGAQQITFGNTAGRVPATQDQVITSIKNYVAKNYGAVSWAGCADPTALTVQPDPGQSCISWQPDLPATTSVRVVLPVRQVKTFFGGIAGLATIAVSAKAAASVGRAASPCSLCVLGNADFAVNDLSLGNGNIVATGAAVLIDGSLNCANGGTITTGGGINGVVGTIDSKCSAGITPAATTIPPFLDPLGGLPAAPDYSGLTPKADCNSQLIPPIRPGIYDNISGCTLSPGLYVIAGGSIGGNGLSALTGNGVTIFLTCGSRTSVRPCNPGESGGSANIGGNGAMTLTACVVAPCLAGFPGDPPPILGMAMWFDRNDASQLKVNGNGAVNVIGTIYGQSVTMVLDGTPVGAGISSEVVVQKVTLNGHNTLSIAYVPGQNAALSVPQLLN